MDEKCVSNSIPVIIPEEKKDSFYPMFFGVSCAFFALKFLPKSQSCDEKLLENMLQGSAHLLGMLVYRFQREASVRNELQNARKAIDELKTRRTEDAKANDKVMSIFSARERSWLDERKKLRRQIMALISHTKTLEAKKEESIAELNKKLWENGITLDSMEKSVEEEKNKRFDLEEKLKKAETFAEELREIARRESQRHLHEISKHKTAFIELVSNQRQLEAEMGRALRQVEAVKHELDSTFDQKEQYVSMTQRLSTELVKTRQDSEQKDQILSAMLRKSKLDTVEKEMLLKEVKLSKKKRRAEIETKGSLLRNMLYKHVNAKSMVDEGNLRSMRSDNRGEYEKPEIRNGLEVFSLGFDPYSTDGTEESNVTSRVEHLENYKIAIEQRHHIEIGAFSEQLRLKDEKLESFRWRLMSMELESKRLESHIEGLDHDMRKIRQENLKLEALLLDRETELHTLKEQLVLQFKPPNLQKLNFNPALHESAIARDTVWSKVKVIKRKPGQKIQEIEQFPQEEERKDIVLTLQYPQNDIKDGKLYADFQQEKILCIENGEMSSSVSQELTKRSDWRMDIHALGVSYKIKRLKQQLIVLERLMGKQESIENGENKNGSFEVKGFYGLMALLNKQVDRYQSLQGKNDDLCKRMHGKNLNLNLGGSAIAKTADETKILEHFLEETFQLQRYIVATGQKLMEVQAKLASGFVNDSEDIEKPADFDMKRYADSIRTLFREVQRGLEVRISRVIGDLEGTLACDGITHMKK